MVTVTTISARLGWCLPACFILRISEEFGDKELKAKACGFLGWSDSELAEYDQSKENNKKSPSSYGQGDGGLKPGGRSRRLLR